MSTGAANGPRSITARLRTRARRGFDRLLAGRIRDLHTVATLPFAALFLLAGQRIHPAHRVSAVAKLRLALRMYRNTRRIETASSYKSHLAIAAKLLELDPAIEGDVVECGCWRGGSTANLSLACELAGRRLIVYDSFEGLPEPEPGDRYATPGMQGWMRGGLEEVRENVERYGAADRVELRRGWFEDTLPGHTAPIVLCVLDVDYEASLRTCVVNLWPRLIERGYMFIDEFLRLDYCALFFSERFWRESFDRDPPGLIGAGAGVGTGNYYLGPLGERVALQAPGGFAYTRPDFSARWAYYPADSEGRT